MKKAYFLILASTLIRLLIAALAPLGDSEAYYSVYAQNLDWSYYDHPPVSAWSIWAGEQIFGRNPLGTRFFSVIFGSLSLLCLYGIALLKEQRQLFPLAFFCFHAMPIMIIGTVMATPDAPMCFFFYLLFFLLELFVKSSKPSLMIAMAIGAVLGLGFISKYFFAVLGISLAYIYIPAYWPKRIKLSHITAIFVFGLIFCLPVLYWNSAQGFPSFHYHLLGRHNAESFTSLYKLFENFIRTSGGALLYFGPWAFLFGLKFLKPINRKDKRELIIKVAFLIMLFCFSLSFLSRESEPHWLALFFLFLPVLSINSGLNHKLFPVNESAVRKSFIFSLILVFTIMIHLKSEVLSASLVRAGADLRWDLANEPRGYDSLISKIEKEKGLKKISGLVSYHYTICSQLDYAIKGKLPVYCINNRNDAFDFFKSQQLESLSCNKKWLYVHDNRYRWKYFEIYETEDKAPENEFSYSYEGTELKKFYYKFVSACLKIRKDAPAL